MSNTEQIECSRLVQESFPSFEEVRRFFSTRGVGAYLVGGTLRDHLLGKVGGDVDLAVGGSALELAHDLATAMGGRYVTMDERNQVARIILKRKGEEDHYLDISTMRDSIETDLACRDFTINAMALELGKRRLSDVIDPFNGRRDLKLGLVKAVSEAALEQDPLRLLRAVRLAAELDFDIEPNTEVLIQHHCHLVTEVSPERVRDELCRIISTPQVGLWLTRIDKLGLLTAIIPELEVCRDVSQPKEHYWDVFAHSLETVAATAYLLGQRPSRGIWQFGDELLSPVQWSAALEAHFAEEVSGGRSRRKLLKLVALLHDIAKPLCRTVDDSGRIRFLRHSQQGAVIATKVLERLRFSTREIETASQAIEHHLRPGSWGEDLPSRRAIYRFFRDTGDTGIDVIFLNLADHLATRGPLLTLPEWAAHAQAAGHVLAQYFEDESAATPPKLVDGHLLMEHFGLSPGPLVGQLLEAIREAQAAGEISTKDEALAFGRSLLFLGGSPHKCEILPHHSLV
ncbi:MAG: HD domain-containing protein [Chloroflexota bacterium]